MLIWSHRSKLTSSWTIRHLFYSIPYLSPYCSYYSQPYLGCLNYILSISICNPFSSISLEMSLVWLVPKLPLWRLDFVLDEESMLHLIIRQNQVLQITTKRRFTSSIVYPAINWIQHTIILKPVFVGHKAIAGHSARDLLGIKSFFVNVVVKRGSLFLWAVQ